MAYDTNFAAPQHRLEMDGREHLIVSGVEDVECFNEQIVVLQTAQGTLTVTGTGLNMSQLNLEEGRVALEGEVDALEYTGGRRKKGGLLGRVLR